MPDNTNYPTGDDLAVVELAARIGQTEPPAGLVEEATDRVLARLDSAVVTRPKTAAHRGLVWATGLAAAVILVAILVNPGHESLAFADMVKALRKTESLRVAGWVLGESGQRIPYQQWVTANGDLRAEIGEASSRTVVVVAQGERLVRAPGGKVYRQDQPAAGQPTLDQAMRAVFQAYEDPESWANHWESAREDLGDIVRFSYRRAVSLGRGPGNLRRVIDVDKTSRLPLRSEVHQMRDGRWHRVSELSFYDYNLKVPAESFTLAGEVQVWGPQEAAEYWYESGITLASIQIPAVLVPADGVAVRWLTGNEPVFDGMSGGASTVSHGGVTTHVFKAMPLQKVIQAITGMRVLGNESAATRVSLEIQVKTTMPWSGKVAPVLSRMGLVAEVGPHEAASARFIFHQNGQEIAPSSHRFATSQVASGPYPLYRYTFERCRLASVVSTMLGNSLENGFDRDTDAEEFAKGEENQSEVFETLVDLEFENPAGLWQTNLELLKEKFGVELRIEKTTRRNTMIKLDPVSE